MQQSPDSSLRSQSRFSKDSNQFPIFMLLQVFPVEGRFARWAAPPLATAALTFHVSSVGIQYWLACLARLALG